MSKRDGGFHNEIVRSLPWREVMEAGGQTPA